MLLTSSSGLAVCFVKGSARQKFTCDMTQVIDVASVALVSEHLDEVMCFLLLWEMCGLCSGDQVVCVCSQVDRKNLATDISPQRTKEKTCAKTPHQGLKFSNSGRLSSSSSSSSSSRVVVVVVVIL